MGACATKPKADANDAPAPLPEKDEVVDAAAHNSRSPTTESEQVKGSAEIEKTEPEPVKEEACEAEKDTKTTQVAKSEILVATASTPTVDAAVQVGTEEAPIEVVDVPAKLETKVSTPTICAVAENESEKEIEVASATEVQKTEAVKEKEIEEHEKAIETPISESIHVDSAGTKPQVVEEKTSAPVEVEADQKIEVASAIEETRESEVCAENVKP